MVRYLPNLGPRAIRAYNRFSKDMASLNYVLQFLKTGGLVGVHTIYQLNHMVRVANRLFRNHPDLPRFAVIDPDVPFTVADFAILVTRLTAASVHFEQRYVHLTVPPEEQTPPHPLLDADGFPSKHIL